MAQHIRRRTIRRTKVGARIVAWNLSECNQQAISTIGSATKTLIGYRRSSQWSPRVALLPCSRSLLSSIRGSLSWGSLAPVRIEPLFNVHDPREGGYVIDFK